MPCMILYPKLRKKIYRNGDKVRVPDEEAIQEAATKIQEIETVSLLA